MSSLLRRSFMIVPRHYLLVNYFRTTGQGASFCSSSFDGGYILYHPTTRECVHDTLSPMPRLFYYAGHVYYKPTTRECVHDTLSPHIDWDINMETQQHNMRKEESHLPDPKLFVILDNPNEKRVILKRNFLDESIQVEVEIVDDEDRQAEHVFDGVRFDSISLVVTIIKGKQSSPLRITCTASPDNNIIVHNVVNRSSEKSTNQNAFGPTNISELGDNGKKDILDFLATRRIDSALANFLHEYMIAKSMRLSLTWLEKMKQFVDYMP